jgi:hypothetical protein
MWETFLRLSEGTEQNHENFTQSVSGPRSVPSTSQTTQDAWEPFLRLFRPQNSLQYRRAWQCHLRNLQKTTTFQNAMWSRNLCKRVCLATTSPTSSPTHSAVLSQYIPRAVSLIKKWGPEYVNKLQTIPSLRAHTNITSHAQRNVLVFDAKAIQRTKLHFKGNYLGLNMRRPVQLGSTQTALYHQMGTGI